MPRGTTGTSVVGALVCDPTTGVYAASVTPPAGSATWTPFTSGHTATFTVQNVGTCTQVWNFTATGTGPITGVTFNPGSASLMPHASTNVTVTYGVRAPGSCVLTVTATGATVGDQSSGSYNVTAAWPAGTPT